MTSRLKSAAAGVDRDLLQLAPLGVPLCIEVAQAAGVIAAACRGWEGDADPGSVPLRLLVERSQALSGMGRVTVRGDSTSLTVQGTGAVGIADVESGFASCAVSADYLQNPGALLHDVLEPLVLMLLTRRDRTPLHASAFVVDGLAILLAGRTGAGKSCLARAADDAGLQVLSDDTIYVQLEPRLKVWGWPVAAHLLDADAPRRAGPVRLRNGKLKHVVPFRSAAPGALSFATAVLCLLSPPGGGRAKLRPISEAEVMDRLWPLDEGFDLLPGPIAAAVARLSAGGAWNLSLSADPAEAIHLLVANAQRLREHGRSAG